MVGVSELGVGGFASAGGMVVTCWSTLRGAAAVGGTLGTLRGCAVSEVGVGEKTSVMV